MYLSSGGSKAVMPGICTRNSIAANHSMMKKILIFYFLRCNSLYKNWLIDFTIHGKR